MSVVVDVMADIGITRVSRWIFNCYVVHNGGNGPIIVDAGLLSACDDIAPVLAGLSGSVQSILATHGHSDHLAGAPEVSRGHDAPIYLPENTFRYLDGRAPRSPGPRDVARIWRTFFDQPMDLGSVAGLALHPKAAGYATSGPMHWHGPLPAGALTDGGSVPGAPSWTVIATPGHTEDSIALWHNDSGTLLAGDAVVTARGRASCTAEVSDPVAAARTEDRLRQLPIQHLLPGHGRPVHGERVVLR
ncbi:MBL fold metallo-hydrolase [Antrihabitans cavernicola]|uniref:MBL fold metallo-hydrolase n=1 Tax=Antrihabitans cavernicola TaxID=2495913 RepID=A0A5A7S835_9NOCA|nr:MBL fold metallo-hydrolase [Spelaeibacter cavernicola]KAA0019442.1 MBL fold metallo-hydrolase [Spelaeibacter cavernicola]